MEPQPAMVQQSIDIAETSKKKLNLPHICLEAMKSSPPLSSSNAFFADSLKEDIKCKVQLLVFTNNTCWFIQMQIPQELRPDSHQHVRWLETL
ncbi:hypothetical protein H5410_059657 [Solanum commersonii]|uniref:Uncharacterized protein n=1 Tax=Solanum commersonii TaxID=4109 RepID=A0A9J5W2Z4_SOLCO|nr:hypothetical protein H5410_059657 [Solanum commersonii]